MGKASTKKQPRAAQEAAVEGSEQAQPSGLLAALHAACRDSLQSGRAADNAAQEALLGALHAVKLKGDDALAHLDGETAAAVQALLESL